MFTLLYLLADKVGKTLCEQESRQDQPHGRSQVDQEMVVVLEKTSAMMSRNGIFEILPSRNEVFEILPSRNEVFEAGQRR